MLRLSAAALLVSLLPAGAAEEPPYVGTWDCEVSSFTFTADTYDAGDGPMPILKIERPDGAYRLSFEDGYAINLANITAAGMDWFSEASGDIFHCTKLDG